LRGIDFQYAARGEKGANGGEESGAAGDEMTNRAFNKKAAVRDGGGLG